MGTAGTHQMLICLSVAAVLLVGGANASLIEDPFPKIIIDDFLDDNSRAFLSVYATPTETVLFDSDEDTGLDPAHAIGGVREATLDGTEGGLTAGSVDVELYGTAPAGGHNGGYMFVDASEDAVPGATLELHYGTLAPSGSELNSDWSAMDTFRMTFYYVRSTTVPVGGELELYWDQGGPNAGSYMIEYGVPDTEEIFELAIPLADFAGADLSDIDGVRVEFGTALTLGQYIELMEIAVIPEPATLTLLAAAGIGLLVRKRRA